MAPTFFFSFSLSSSSSTSSSSSSSSSSFSDSLRFLFVVSSLRLEIFALVIASFLALFTLALINFFLGFLSDLIPISLPGGNCPPLLRPVRNLVAPNLFKIEG
uniref:Uncharacterized protein n=1 Tax=Panstrongylus lignarius TaxID=156445 RepID=A0A224Y2Y4_9HEMI